MPDSEIKLTRVPINTKCADADCGKPLPFGTWAHWHADSKQAICIECGAKRGWTDKDRANNIIKKLELQEDIKALRKQQKVEADALYLLREQVDLHRLGERSLDLEKQIVALMSKVNSYLSKVATAEEKAALKQVYEEIKGTQELQGEIWEQLESRLFLLEREERKVKKRTVPKVVA
jgi:hypothetical protein